MKQRIIVFAFAGICLVLVASDTFGRGGRGGGGARPGGGYPGAGRPTGGMPGGAVHSYGGNVGGGAGNRVATVNPAVGPRGGTGATGKVGGSYTTKGGSTIDYKGAGVGGTTPGGISGGRYVGGVQVTTPGGKEMTHVGAGKGAVGPGGNAVGSKSGASVGSGPNGSFATKSHSGGAIGPNGAAGYTNRAGVANTPSGLYGGVSHSGAAIGPYGAAGVHTGVGYNPYGSAATRSVYRSGPSGTYYRNTTAVRGQSTYVRTSVSTYPCFRPNWYRNNPGVWYAAGWASANAVWRYPAWPALVDYGYPATPVYYDYGDNVVYQTENVYVNGEPVGTPQEFSQQASELAETGKKAEAPKTDEWMPLGVFAMVQGDEQTSNNIFQLALNKKGVLRGTYYDAVTDVTYPLAGAVDPKTQRAAWTVGDRKTPVYEAGIANLTKEATTMMVHYTERSSQFTLVRLEEPKEESSPP
jgi:hypothetical protein